MTTEIHFFAIKKRDSWWLAVGIAKKPPSPPSSTTASSSSSSTSHNDIEISDFEKSISDITHIVLRAGELSIFFLEIHETPADIKTKQINKIFNFFKGKLVEADNWTNNLNKFDPENNIWIAIVTGACNGDHPALPQCFTTTAGNENPLACLQKPPPMPNLSKDVTPIPAKLIIRYKNLLKDLWDHLQLEDGHENKVLVYLDQCFRTHFLPRMSRALSFSVLSPAASASSTVSITLVKPTLLTSASVQPATTSSFSASLLTPVTSPRALRLSRSLRTLSFVPLFDPPTGSNPIEISPNGVLSNTGLLGSSPTSASNPSSRPLSSPSETIHEGAKTLTTTPHDSPPSSKNLRTSNSSGIGTPATFSPGSSSPPASSLLKTIYEEARTSTTVLPSSTSETLHASELLKSPEALHFRTETPLDPPSVSPFTCNLRSPNSPSGAREETNTPTRTSHDNLSSKAKSAGTSGPPRTESPTTTLLSTSDAPPRGRSLSFFSRLIGGNKPTSPSNGNVLDETTMKKKESHHPS